MRFPSSRPLSCRGSALVTAIVFTGVVMIMVASILQWSLTERRLNHRHELRLEARNAAEAAAEFGFAQVRHKLENRTSFLPEALNPGGTDALSPIPAEFGGDASARAETFRSLFAGTHVDPDSIEVLGGVGRTITDPGSATFYVDPADPNNQFDPLKGKRIFRRDVQILARATVRPPAGGPPITSHIVETLAMREAPLFSHAIFYNMDLELAPGANMTIFGPVHSNGNLWVTGQASNNSRLDFVGPVTVSGGLYFGYEVTPKMAAGQAEPTTDEDIRFVNRAGNLINLRANGIWRDHKMGQSSTTAETRDAFRTFSSQTYNGNLQTSVHGIEDYKPVAFDQYVKDPTPTNGIEESVNSGRAIIEKPLDDDDPRYNAEVEAQKYSRKSGLYITVNPSETTRSGRRPDGSTVSLGPGEWRAFRQDGTEVFLPGHPDHPVPAARAGSTRPVIRVRHDQMYDLRRVQNGYDPALPRSSSNRYAPKELDLVELDMTALKMAVDRSVNGSGQSSIYPYDDNASLNNQSTYRASSPTTVSLSDANVIANYGDEHWNGAVYIESAEAEEHRDSGVRIINARGRVAGRPINNPNDPGLTLATNDAMYVLGHFNADGSLASGSNAASRYAENNQEVPAALAADAITILSQPKFSGSTQTGGWSDALSGLVSHGSSSNNWQTSNPSSSNQRDGWDHFPGDSSKQVRLPTSNNPLDKGTKTSSGRTTKFTGQNTEISAAMLTGITPSNKNGSNQYSGGAHNFPRLLEHWGSNPQNDLVIRGSMVALFESRVATEPWSIRVYNAPERYWGFHDMFAQGIYPPQTPRVRTYRRVDFRDVTAEEYQDLVAALPW